MVGCTNNSTSSRERISGSRTGRFTTETRVQRTCWLGSLEFSRGGLECLQRREKTKAPVISLSLLAGMLNIIWGVLQLRNDHIKFCKFNLLLFQMLKCGSDMHSHTHTHTYTQRNRTVTSGDGLSYFSGRTVGCQGYLGQEYVLRCPLAWNTMLTEFNIHLQRSGSYFVYERFQE
jgi:hypothetical protein